MARTRRQSSEAARKAEFEALITPLLDALYGTALRLTRSPAEAEDLLQDACVKAYRFLDRYERGTNFRAWMFKVLTNTFHSRYRKNQRDREVRQQMVTEGQQDHIVAQGPAREAQQAEAAILDHMLSEDIQEALSHLSPEFRMVILLCDVEEFSYREIAEIMDCPVGTVMSRLYRARRQLQELLLEQAAERGIVSAGAIEARRAGGGEGEGASGQAPVADLVAYRQQRKR